MRQSTLETFKFSIFCKFIIFCFAKTVLRAAAIHAAGNGAALLLRERLGLKFARAVHYIDADLQSVHYMCRSLKNNGKDVVSQTVHYIDIVFQNVSSLQNAQKPSHRAKARLPGGKYFSFLSSIIQSSEAALYSLDMQGFKLG